MAAVAAARLEMNAEEVQFQTGLSKQDMRRVIKVVLACVVCARGRGSIRARVHV